MGVDNNQQSGYNVENSIFVQVYKSLGDHARSDAIFRGSSDKWFSVTLEGEHASDAGGVFRETISNISDDLMSERTPLFIRTPNNKEEVGDLRDVWMPNPSCQRFELFEFVGRLMAGAIQTDENIVVQLSPFVWRRIGGAPCTVEQYTSGVSQSLVNYLKCADLDEETFEFCCNTYSLQRADGTTLDLVPGGSEVRSSLARAAARRRALCLKWASEAATCIWHSCCVLLTCIVLCCFGPGGGTVQ
jgi:E3 ubiquitin-protein ligase HECTD3